MIGSSTAALLRIRTSRKRRDTARLTRCVARWCAKGGARFHPKEWRQPQGLGVHAPGTLPNEGSGFRLPTWAIIKSWLAVKSLPGRASLWRATTPTRRCLLRALLLARHHKDCWSLDTRSSLRGRRQQERRQGAAWFATGPRTGSAPGLPHLLQMGPCLVLLPQ